MVQQPRVGRRRSTTPQHIADAALGLFAEHGFSEVSVDDVAQAAGIARRTVFRYYASKNAIPWETSTRIFSTYVSYWTMSIRAWRLARHYGRRCCLSTLLTNPKPLCIASGCG